MDDDVDLVSRYEERTQLLETYRRTWWSLSDEPQSSYLRKHPDVRARLLQRTIQNKSIETRHMYADEAGMVWDHERVRLHEEILTTLSASEMPVATLSGNGASRGDSSVDGGHAVYFLLGLPGSGKSTSLRPIAEAHSRFAGRLPCSDADAVRVLFPEYADGLGSGVVQAETAVVTYGLSYRQGDGRQSRVLATRSDVIVDVIGDPDWLPVTVRHLAAQDRQVYVLLTECSSETCRARVMKRTVEQGRYVPVELVDAKVGIPKQAMAAALDTGKVAGWAVLDTEGAGPVVVDSDGSFEHVLARIGMTNETRR